MKPTIEDIKTYVKNNSWFEEDENEDVTKAVSFITRDNGDVGEEEAGEDDVKKAYEVGRALLDKYGKETISVNVEIIDEWVYITVIIKD